MIETFTDTTIKNCKQPFAIKCGSTWYSFPKAIKEATISDYKLWGDDSGRSMTGSSKGTLTGIFPKLQVTIGKQNANDRAILCKCLNQTAATVRAYCVERKRFETASFYFGDVTNKIKHWDKHGTLGTLSGGNQSYSCKSMTGIITTSVISSLNRSTSSRTTRSAHRTIRLNGRPVCGLSRTDITHTTARDTLRLPRVRPTRSRRNILLNSKEESKMTPTGNRLIDTVIYVAGSAIAFNVVLPIFAAVIKLLGLM